MQAEEAEEKADQLAPSNAPMIVPPFSAAVLSIGRIQALALREAPDLLLHFAHLQEFIVLG